MKTMQDWIREKTENLEDAGAIPLDRAGICWDIGQRRAQRQGPITDMHVVDLEDARARRGEDGLLWERATMTGGACLLDWKEGRNPRHTPLGKFAELCFDGEMPSGDDFFRLLREFAKIEGCDWALHMIAALRMGDFITEDDEEMRLT